MVIGLGAALLAAVVFGVAAVVQAIAARRHGVVSLLMVGVAAAYVGREGISFAGTFGAIAFAVTGMFVAMFPDVMPSSTDVAFSLNTTNAAATSYTLTIMTWIAVIFTPIVLGYQTWTYWVFRKRIGTHHIPTAELASQ